MAGDNVVVIGAGIGGLAAAALLAARGLAVTVVERMPSPGGKLRQLPAGGAMVDAGPTVFTLRHVFDELFDAAGSDFESMVHLKRADVLARHAWPDGARLDLFAERAASSAAIRQMAGDAAADGFDAFMAEAAAIHRTLDASFMQRPRTNPIGLTWRLGLGRIAELQATRPYESLWKALGEHFADSRLRQLFGRYSTYTGASPFAAPATLMLIAHVEAQGVWLVEGGMQQLAFALADVARRSGAEFRFGSDVAEILLSGSRVAGVRLADGERIEAGSVIANCDPSAIGSGLFGAAARRATRPLPAARRSLSALTWAMHAETGGFPLDRHNVFFSGDYPAEFAALAQGRLADDPSIYVCAQDRSGDAVPQGPERLQMIINAPANGDTHDYATEEMDQCEARMLNSLQRSGLCVRNTHGPPQRVTPADYAKLFPATGGALYGRASHGWAASFLRPGSKTAISGLYLAGGATHPGAGVPMAALSGRLASEALLRDRASMARFRPVAMPGGMSMRSATTVGSALPSSPSSAASSRPIM